jgi:hypothetical protein
VVTRPIHGARPFGASLRLFKIVPDDFVATVRLALPALATFLKQLLSLGFQLLLARSKPVRLIVQSTPQMVQSRNTPDAMIAAGHHTE